MKILILCDDYYHHSNTVIKGLDYLKEIHTLEIIEDASEISSEKFSQYPLIIISKSNNISSLNRTNWMTGDLENAFVDYVKNGGSIIVIHSGTAGYKNTPIYRQLIGGVFTHHPEPCEVKLEPIKNHPITSLVEPFVIYDEHYHMDIDEKEIDIIMNTISIAGVQPGAWTRKVGSGKVFVFTPGHYLNVWLNDQFKKIILNAINWCIK